MVSDAAGQGVTITGSKTFNNWNWPNAVIFAATVITTIGASSSTSIGRTSKNNDSNSSIFKTLTIVAAVKVTTAVKATVETLTAISVTASVTAAVTAVKVTAAVTVITVTTKAAAKLRSCHRPVFIL